MRIFSRGDLSEGINLYVVQSKIDLFTGSMIARSRLWRVIGPSQKMPGWINGEVVPFDRCSRPFSAGRKIVDCVRAEACSDSLRVAVIARPNIGPDGLLDTGGDRCFRHDRSPRLLGPWPVAHPTLLNSRFAIRDPSRRPLFGVLVQHAMKRAAVFGNAGGGKSTFTRRLVRPGLDTGYANGARSPTPPAARWGGRRERE